jgi:outer membrane protein assembly factor BamB
VLIALVLVAAQDWPRWRGPDGSGVSAETRLPERWTSKDNIAWSVVVPGEGASSPVARGDDVFLTSAFEGGARRTLWCLDRRTGATRWSLETPDPNPERASALTGHAAPTPAADAARVVAFFGNAGVVCAGPSGEALWRRSLGEFSSELGIASSPVLYQDLVLLVCDHDGASFLAALDAKTGEIRWKTARPGLERSWSTPILAAGELVVNAQDELRGYDPGTGAALWRVRGMSGWVTPSPVFGKGMIFATSGKDGPTLAVRPGGRGDVAPVWREARGGPYVCSPLLYGELLYVVDEAGRLVARDAATGEAAWRARLKGKFSASPVAGDGKVYLTNEEGTTFVLRAGRTFDLLAENPLGEEILASAAIARRSIFLRTRGRLYRVGSAD